MYRNLDMVALRAFSSVAELGGVTKAASVLNLTQSAVSMQLKRLENALGVALFTRAGRGISMTPEGEQLLSYARRILALNDEIFQKLTAQEYEGEITLGVPHDIVPHAIPQVLRKFNAEFPRMRVQLISSWTTQLLERFEAGKLDVMVTTELGVSKGGETLFCMPLVWVGAPASNAWRARPLRLAFESDCIFKGPTLAALDEASIPWDMAVRSNSTRTIEATVGADLAVTAIMEGVDLYGIEPIAHAGALPALPAYDINLYRRPGFDGEAADRLAELLRQTYRDVMSSSRRPSPLSAAS